MYTLTKEFREVLETEAKEMISLGLNKKRIEIQGTKIKPHLIKSGTPEQNEYSANIIDEIKVDGIVFYLAR